MTYFDEILPRVWREEGGYVDHPKDPGGATNFGITHITLAAWRGLKSVGRDDVKRLQKTEAANIYKANYWGRIKGDKLPRGLAYAVLDFAINSGASRAVRFLQKAVGARPDGVVGPVTLRLIGAADPAALILLLVERRLGFLRRLRTWATFGDGWSARLGRVLKHALSDIGENTDLSKANPPAVKVSGIRPLSRPRQSAEVTRAIIDAHRHLLPNDYRHAGAVVLFVRGYYSKSFGKAGNDRGVYDDAAFIVSPDRVIAFNANSDPSAWRKGVATLKAPQAILYVKGRHGLSRKGPDGKPGIIAWRQASDVTVIRDKIGEDRDSASNRFWTNMHPGGNAGTSSLGCLTVPRPQWPEYLREGYAAMDQTGQTHLPVILLEYDGNNPPIPQAEPDFADTTSPPTASLQPVPTIQNPQNMETNMMDDIMRESIDPTSNRKPWFKSKGVIGSLGAIISPLAGIAGYNLSPADVQEVIVHIAAITTAASGLLALIGRLVAKTGVR